MENRSSEHFPSEETSRSTPSPSTPPGREESPGPPILSSDRYDEHQDPSNLLRPSDNREEGFPIRYSRPSDPPSNFSQWGLPLGLFGVTIFTTLWAGAYQLRPDFGLGAWDFLIKYPENLLRGVPFAATLLAILVTHEFGHYIYSKIHRVPASLPLFIPGPPHFIGTFGAVIRMRTPIMNRRALFDIGVAGPIAGFLVTVIAMIVGLLYSTAIPQEYAYGSKLGEPLLLQFLIWLIFGPLPENSAVFLHPIASAAWFGFFVTAINLIPLGQLDGGHVAFAVFGQRQRVIALTTIPVLIYLGVTGWPGWLLWVALAGLIGISHPPVGDPEAVLGRKRIWVAWSALAIFVVSFAPVPFYFG